jgi:hypothetical protein
MDIDWEKEIENRNLTDQDYFKWYNSVIEKYDNLNKKINKINKIKKSAIISYLYNMNLYEFDIYSPGLFSKDDEDNLYILLKFVNKDKLIFINIYDFNLKNFQDLKKIPFSDIIEIDKHGKHSIWDINENFEYRLIEPGDYYFNNVLHNARHKKWLSFEKVEDLFPLFLRTIKGVTYV